MPAAGLLDRLERYLALRRALGFHMRDEERRLRDFVVFIEAHGTDGPVQAQTAIAWVCSTGDRCGTSGQAQRLSMVRGFLAFLRAAEPETEVPGPRVLRRPVRPTPHIYSEAEVEALMTAARQLPPPGSLRPVTFRTLIGLLLSTGLRVGEALRLQETDVELDQDPPRLVVRLTKFRKSRLVPVHPSTAAALRTYAELRRRLGYSRRCSAFFISERRGPLRRTALTATFLSLARQIGLRGPAGEKGPSLQCFRHTFAVRRLLAWCAEGADVRARLPELSVYLGHVRPQATYWYLTAAPELLRLASDRFEAHVHAGPRS
jgi:integrase/recombinase XerD